jgi:hypothetical protein
VQEETFHEGKHGGYVTKFGNKNLHKVLKETWPGEGRSLTLQQAAMTLYWVISYHMLAGRLLSACLLSTISLSAFWPRFYFVFSSVVPIHPLSDSSAL